MSTNKATTTSVLAALAVGLASMISQAAFAGDLRSQRFMSGVPAAGTTMKAGNQSTEAKPYVPPRAPGIRPGDQVDFVYEGRPNSYSFGKIVAIMPAGWNLHPPKVGTVRDHRGKTASKPPSTPPGAPPPAAPPPEVSGPPAAPPGTVPTPPASGNVVRDHTNEYWPKVTTTKVKDHREGYGGDTYVQKSFTDTWGVTPHQKPPCFGDACWFFGR